MLKILFISRYKQSTKISPIVENQLNSLKKKGIEPNVFLLKGSGFKGYLKNINRIKNHLKNNKYDVIHAHYSLTGFVASLAGSKPLVVSLMGSDTETTKFKKRIIHFFAKKYWDAVIVKSERMKENINTINVNVLPNGVDFNLFKPIERSTSLNETTWDPDKKHILFASNPEREEKNFQLTLDAYNQLDKTEYQLHYIKDIPNHKMPFYYNSADVVILTSKREGSPNVIKEAMACNRPIVVTDVGDVRKVIGETENCYIVKDEKNEVADAIQTILGQNYISTNGRKNIEWLSEDKIAEKLINIYKSVK